MTQVLLTSQIITNSALEILENDLVITSTVNRKYEDRFAVSGGKIGDTVNIRLPDRALVSNGAALQVQEENQQSVALTINYQKQIGISFTGADLVLKIDEFEENILKPRISQLAADIDFTVATDSYSQIYNSVGTPGTTPSTPEVLLAGMQKLDEMAAMRPNRYWAVNPAANASLVSGMKGLLNPVTTISDQFKTGMMGVGVLGLKQIAMTQSIPNHTTGSRTSTPGTILVNGTVSTQGQATLSFDGDSGSATVTKGDVFTVAGVYSVNPQTRATTGSLQQFVVTAASTASGGAWTDVTIQPPMFTSSNALATINAFPQDGAAVTFMGAASTAYPQNLMYHRDAITFATVDDFLPQGGVEMAARSVHNGISMRMVKQFNIQNDQDPCRIDVLFGSKVIRPQMAVRVWG